MYVYGLAASFPEEILLWTRTLVYVSVSSFRSKNGSSSSGMEINIKKNDSSMSTGYHHHA
jgi:hypothetical protein